MGEHFVLLAAVSKAAMGTALDTRPVGRRVANADVLVALDAEGHKHLLVPVPTGETIVEWAGEGVTLGPRMLRVGTRDVKFVDVHCRIPALDLVFERLLDDILTRLAADDSAPLLTCLRTLDDWKALLAVAGRGISRELAIGLVGELEVLRLLAPPSPHIALQAWQGPNGAIHDFIHGGSRIEVKTTSSVDGNTVPISNLDQLDPTLADALHLVVVHVSADPTAPRLDERIDALIRAGLPRQQLIDRVQAAGYAYEARHEMDDRYTVRSVRAWLVGDTFPGLRRGEIDQRRLQGVAHIRYDLLLDATPEPLTAAEFERFLASWSTS